MGVECLVTRTSGGFRERSFGSFSTGLDYLNQLILPFVDQQVS